jgi:hypothetical protein
VEHNALQEAGLVVLRLDAVQAWAALLFDCRGALQIELANTATDRATAPPRAVGTAAVTSGSASKLQRPCGEDRVCSHDLPGTCGNPVRRVGIEPGSRAHRHHPRACRADIR